MLPITVKERELFDESTSSFIQVKETHLQLEHSLVSISKWEAKYHKPFLSQNEKTDDETLYYIKCMTMTQNVDDNVYIALASDVKTIQRIKDYIEDPMTATWFGEDRNKGRRNQQRATTAEVIYGWMIQMNIPFECQKWHLNRLLTLIRVCNDNNNPKKMSKNDIYQQNASLNAMRRKAMNSAG